MTDGYGYILSQDLCANMNLQRKTSTICLKICMHLCIFSVLRQFWFKIEGQNMGLTVMLCSSRLVSIGGAGKTDAVWRTQGQQQFSHIDCRRWSKN